MKKFSDVRRSTVKPALKQASISLLILLFVITALPFNISDAASPVGILADDDQSSFWVAQKGVTVIDDSYVQKFGVNSLRVSVQNLTKLGLSGAFIYHEFGSGQDWSSYDTLSFWWHSSASGKTVEVNIDAPDPSNKFQAIFTDNHEGWHQFRFSLNDFISHGNPKWSNVTLLSLGGGGWSNSVYHLDYLTLTVEHPPAVQEVHEDFTLTPSPLSQNVAAGSSVNFELTVASIGNYSGGISLSVSGLPSGTAAMLTQAGGGGSIHSVMLHEKETVKLNLSVSTSSFTPLGDHHFTVTGIDGSRTQSVYVTLYVKSENYSETSVSVNSTTVILGKSITISGEITPTRAKSLDAYVTLIFHRPDGTTYVTSTPPTPLGRYVVEYTPDQAGLWDVKALWRGDALQEGSESGVAQFNVKASSSIDVSVSPSTVPLGSDLTITGSISPPLSVPVNLTLTKPEGSTVTRQVNSNPDGSYAEVYSPDAVGLWGVKASWLGDAYYEGDESEAAAFHVERVQTSVSINLNSTDISVGQSFMVSGEVSPVDDNVPVTLMYTRPDGGVVVRSNTSNSGTFNDVYTPDMEGSWSVEAAWSGDVKHREAASGAVNFTVGETLPPVNFTVTEENLQVNLTSSIKPDHLNETVKTSPMGMLTDEDQSIFWTAQTGATVSDDSYLQKFGVNSLRVDVQNLTKLGLPGAFIYHEFSPGQDWSSYDTLAFWWHGSASNKTVEVNVDAPNPENKFQATFADGYEGWHQYKFRLDDFISYGNPLWSNVTLISVGGLGWSDGVYHLDYLTLSVEHPPTAQEDFTSTTYYEGDESGAATFHVKKTQTSVSIDLNSTDISVGQSFMVSGEVLPLDDNVPVTLTYTRPDGSTVVSSTISNSGIFNDIYTPDMKGSWSVEAAWRGDVKHEEAASRVIGFTVGKAPSTISLTATTQDSRVDVAGSIEPSYSNVTVKLTLISPDWSTTTVNVTTSLAGSFSESFSLNQSGLWKVEASWEGDDDHQPAVNSIQLSFTKSPTVIMESHPPEYTDLTTPGVFIAALFLLLSLFITKTSETPKEREKHAGIPASA